MRSPTLFGWEAEDLHNGAISVCCSCFSDFEGIVEESEKIRGEDGVSFEANTFEEKAGCDVAALIEFEEKLQWSTGGDGDEWEGDKSVKVVKSGE